MPGDSRSHPRARALRITYVLLGLWFVAGAVALGILVDDAAATVVVITLLSVAFVLGLTLSESIGLVPGGGAWGRADKRFVFCCALGAMAGVLLTTIPVGVDNRLPVEFASLGLAVSLGSSAAALRRMLGS